MTDLKVFNQLFTEYQGRFIRFANSYVKDLAIAEDFTMEAFMRYWENRHSIQPDSTIPAYILTIIKHKCLNHLQHMQVRGQAAGHIQDHAAWELQTRISTLEACDPEELFSTEAMEIVQNALKTMPARTREIFLMSRYQNKTYKEIASQLELTEKGVEFHISKALKLLRHHLKDYLPVWVYLFL